MNFPIQVNQEQAVWHIIAYKIYAQCLTITAVHMDSKAYENFMFQLAGILIQNMKFLFQLLIVVNSS